MYRRLKSTESESPESNSRGKKGVAGVGAPDLRHESLSDAPDPSAPQTGGHTSSLRCRETTKLLQSLLNLIDEQRETGAER